MNRGFLLAGVLALATCGEPDVDRLALAKTEYAARDYAQARVHLAAAHLAQPDNREILLLQAKTAIALGDGDGAGAALGVLAGRKPPEGRIAELAAEAALLRKAPEVALELLGDAATPEAERLRAMAALLDEDTETAQVHLDRAIAAGGSARVFADYARLRLTAGDAAGAKALAARASRAAPGWIDALLVEAQLASHGGEHKRALALYSRAARLYPSSFAALTGKAEVLGELGLVKEMDAAIAAAAELAPHEPEVVFLTARSAAARKNWKGVRAALQPVEATLNQRDPIRLLYGEALLRLGQVELAIAQLQPVARALPDDRDAQMLLGEALLASGDAVSAINVLGPLVTDPAARREELALAAKAARAANDPSAAELELRARKPTQLSRGPP